MIHGFRRIDNIWLILYLAGMQSEKKGNVEKNPGFYELIVRTLIFHVKRTKQSAIF